jgi:hypothetical protein
MELNTSILISVFLVMSFILLASYAYCLYQMARLKPENLDIDGLWSGFYENNDKNKPRLMVWVMFFVGEILSWCGVIAHVLLFLVYEDDFPIAFVFLYFFFFVSLLFWPLCAIHGVRYYKATIVGLLLTAAFSGSLFGLSLSTWGYHSFRSYVLLPLFVHCFVFDLMIWVRNWKPKDTRCFAELKNNENVVVFSIEEDET